jgi:hypothetical protein
MDRIQPSRDHTPQDSYGAVTVLVGVCVGMLCAPSALGSELTDWTQADEVL